MVAATRLYICTKNSKDDFFYTEVWVWILGEFVGS